MEAFYLFRFRIYKPPGRCIWTSLNMDSKVFVSSGNLRDDDIQSCSERKDVSSSSLVILDIFSEFVIQYGEEKKTGH